MPPLGSAGEVSGLGGHAVTVLETTKKLGATVFVAFVLISFWSNPSGSAQVFTDFIADVGGFFSTVIDKGAEFVQGLTS